MKAFIYFNAPLRSKQPKDYSGEGGYVLVTEDNKCIGRHYCSSRSFANRDLTVTEDRIKALQENNISEVYSNGNLVRRMSNMIYIYIYNKIVRDITH